jgi:hypothetical protein
MSEEWVALGRAFSMNAIALAACLCVATSPVAAAAEPEGVAALRVQGAFEASAGVPTDPKLAAAAWQSHHGRIFAAISCLVQGSPELAGGCGGGAPSGPSHSVQTSRVEAPAGSPEEAADILGNLDGWWENGADILRIDLVRAQANTDPERPFEWDRFLVKELSDGEIVFSIGADLYQAEIDGDALVLSGTSFRGERTLFRQAAAGDR